MKQPEFAEKTGLKLDTLRSVESGRLKMSVELTLRIAAATNAHVTWLSSNDLAAPILGRFGPYTKHQYALAQTARDRADPSAPPQPEEDDYPETIIAAVARLSGVFMNLGKRTPGDVEAATWRVSKFLDELEAEYGIHEDVKAAVSKVGLYETGSVAATLLAKLVLEPDRPLQRHAAERAWMDHQQQKLGEAELAETLNSITNPAVKAKLERLATVLRKIHAASRGRAIQTDDLPDEPAPSSQAAVSSKPQRL